MDAITRPSDEIWRALMGRAEAYCAATGTRLPVLMRALTGNPSFRARIRDGGTITLATLDKMSMRLAALEAAPERLKGSAATERMAAIEAQFHNGDHNGQAQHGGEDADCSDEGERHRNESAALY